MWGMLGSLGKQVIYEQIIYQSWVLKKCPPVCDDRISLQVPIEEEQWTAVFAL